MILSNLEDARDVLLALKEKLGTVRFDQKKVLAGFDGFVDSMVRFQSPADMKTFGTEVHGASGIATSAEVLNQGDQMGGNGPLLTKGLGGLANDQGTMQLEINIIGAFGDNEVSPLFLDVLGDSVKEIFTVAKPAQSTCLEFTDGKVMLSDFDSLNELNWDSVNQAVGAEKLEEMFLEAEVIAAVNWAKVPNMSDIWRGLISLSEKNNTPQKRLFLDLAEFAPRLDADKKEMFDLFPEVAKHFDVTLSLNMKEGWQLAELGGGDFYDQRSPESVLECAQFIRSKTGVKTCIVHPNDGAAVSSADEESFILGPVVKDPLISTGAGDHFGAGVVAGMLLGLSRQDQILLGSCTSGYFVRSGHSPSVAEICQLLELWTAGELGERFPSSE